MERTGFETLQVYQLSEDIADLVWTVVLKWNNFEKDTLGKQLVRTADSIGANIAEGTGRGSYADNKRFAKIARASLFEVKHFLRRAYIRNLLNKEEITKFQQVTRELLPKMGACINSIGCNDNTR